MNKIAAGTKYLKIGFIHDFILSPFPVLASSMNLSQPHPNLLQQNSASTSDPSGRILLDTIKSHKSSHAVPSANGWNLITLYPSAVVNASTKIPAAQTTHPFGRDHPVSSRTIARIFSQTPSTVDPTSVLQAYERILLPLYQTRDLVLH